MPNKSYRNSQIPNQSLTIQNPNQDLDNLRDKLDLYYTLYQTVIYLMKGIGAKYRHTIKTINSIEKSSKLLNLINKQFYDLSTNKSYNKDINDKDKIKMYQIAFDTNDNELKTIIYNSIKDTILKKKLDNIMSSIVTKLAYFPGAIANIAGKGLSSIAIGVQGLFTGFFTFFVSGFEEIDTYTYQHIINEYDEKITQYYECLNIINENLINKEITSEQSFLLNTKERIYNLSFLNYLNNRFYWSENKLLNIITKLNFKNDEEIYNILLKIYPISDSDEQYKKIDTLFNEYFPINNNDPNFILFNIILLKICFLFEFITISPSNKKNSLEAGNYLLIDINIIDSINEQFTEIDKLLISNNKKKINKINNKLLNLFKKNKKDIIVDLIKIISKNENILLIEKYNNTLKSHKCILKTDNNEFQIIKKSGNKIIEKIDINNNLKIIKNIIINKFVKYLINNESKYNNTKFINFLQNIKFYNKYRFNLEQFNIQNKIINYLIEKQNLNNILSFLKYLDPDQYLNTFNYMQRIIESIEYYIRNKKKTR
jgi:hypothetical protein